MVLQAHIPGLDGALAAGLAILDQLRAMPARRVVRATGPVVIDRRLPMSADYLRQLASDHALGATEALAKDAR